jgi:hypothetical protein
MNWLLLLNIFKSLKNSKSLINACLNNKAKSSTIILGLLAFTYCFVELSGIHKHQAKHKVIGDINKRTKFVDNILRGCGDMTAISISSIDIVKNTNGEWLANFEVAEACDKREKKNNCIIHLKERNHALYGNSHAIRYNTYELFVNLGTNTLNSKKFNLRKNKKQNMDELHNYPSMLNIVKKTEWYQSGQLYNLWTTAIIKDILNERYVLYIITFLSGTPTKDLSCFDQDAILNNIKNFIINN